MISSSILYRHATPHALPVGHLNRGDSLIDDHVRLDGPGLQQPSARKLTPVPLSPASVLLAYDMPLDAFKQHLQALRTPLDPATYALTRQSHEKVADEAGPPLSLECSSDDYSTRWVYRALADIANVRSLGPHWSSVDYNVAAALALALEKEQILVDAVRWHPGVTQVNGGWTPERAFTATAISAYLDYEKARTDAGDDEHKRMFFWNDANTYRAVLWLNNEDCNPCLPRAQA